MRLALPDSSTAVTVTSNRAPRRERAGSIRVTASWPTSTAALARTRRGGVAAAAAMQGSPGQRTFNSIAERCRRAALTLSAGGWSSEACSAGLQEPVTRASASSR